MFTCTYFMNDSVAWRNFTYNMHATRKQLHVWSYDHTTRKGFRNLDSQESTSWLLVSISTEITILNHYIYCWAIQPKLLHCTLLLWINIYNIHASIMHNHPLYVISMARERVRECGGTTPCWWIPLNSMKTTCLASREPR